MLLLDLLSNESDRDLKADTIGDGLELKFGIELVLLLLLLPDDDDVVVFVKSILTLFDLGDGGDVNFLIFEFMFFLRIFGGKRP